MIEIHSYWSFVDGIPSQEATTVENIYIHVMASPYEKRLLWVVSTEYS